MDAILAEPLLYLSMPIISALVGWGTNVVAIKMMFYPLAFIGIKPYLGWQGIIPRRSKRMATIAMDLLMARLLKIEELAQRLDPVEAARVLEEPLLSVTEDAVETIMDQHNPMIWASLPNKAKQEIYDRVRAEFPNAIQEMVNALQTNIHEYIDVRDMLITDLDRDKDLLNRIFQEVGAKEFKFIAHSGIYFGFLFGVIQMMLWTVYQANWVLPAAGVAVGFITNWLALKLIFNPKNPIKIGPVTIQGLFLKRQKQVSADYGRLIADELLNPVNLTDAMLRGPLSDNLFKLVERNIQKVIDNVSGGSKPLVLMVIGTQSYFELKNAIADQVMKKLPYSLDALHPSTEKSLDVKNTLSERMQQLTPDEFIGMLRPAFEQDEWILIGVGALLGFGVGLFQLMVLFGGGV